MDQQRVRITSDLDEHDDALDEDCGKLERKLTESLSEEKWRIDNCAKKMTNNPEDERTWWPDGQMDAPDTGWRWLNCHADWQNWLGWLNSCKSQLCASVIGWPRWSGKRTYQNEKRWRQLRCTRTYAAVDDSGSLRRWRWHGGAEKGGHERWTAATDKGRDTHGYNGVLLDSHANDAWHGKLRDAVRRMR